MSESWISHFEKSRKSLKNAIQYADNLSESADSAELLLMWENFVDHWSKARKFALQAAGRFGNKKIEGLIRKAEKSRDGVVCYLFHTRNAEWYGVEAVVVAEHDMNAIGRPDSKMRVGLPTNAHVTMSNVGFITKMPDGTTRTTNVDSLSSTPRLGLVSSGSGPLVVEKMWGLKARCVADRGEVFYPPSKNGIKMAPEEIAKDAVEWLSMMIAKIKE